MQKTKSIQANATANYVGLGYTVLIGVITFPLYLGYMGAEAFGLVGFYIVLQSWMQLLEMGMSPIMSQQTALVRAQDRGFLELKRLLRSFETITFIMSSVAALLIAYSSNWITTKWLSITSLDLTDVQMCIIIMGLIVGLRIFSSLYRGGIQGMENQVQLNICNIFIASTRSIGSLLLLQFVTQDVLHFFFFQLLISLIELALLHIMFYRSIPTIERVGFGIFWNTLKPILPFAAGLAYASWAWVLLTQMDKIVLSKVLSLSEYGYFSLVAVIAAGVLQITRPISQAILPRMTFLVSQNRKQEMFKLYRKSTQLIMVVIAPVSGMIAVFSTELLIAWTGDRTAAEWAGPILFWFALGNCLLAMSAFQYYLQYAHGKLKMHVLFTTVSAAIQIPAIIYAAFEYGAMGVALTWFAFRLVTFSIWTPIVHRKISPGLHWQWFLKDVLPSCLLTGLLLVSIQLLNIDLQSMNRLEILISLLLIGLTILGLNVLFSNESRILIINAIQSVRDK